MAFSRRAIAAATTAASRALGEKSVPQTMRRVCFIGVAFLCSHPSGRRISNSGLRRGFSTALVREPCSARDAPEPSEAKHTTSAPKRFASAQIAFATSLFSHPPPAAADTVPPSRSNQCGVAPGSRSTSPCSDAVSQAPEAARRGVRARRGARRTWPQRLLRHWREVRSQTPTE